jgi:hypothetical protein
MKWLLSLLLFTRCVTVWGQSTSAAPGCPNYQATKVLDAARNMRSGITVISAHRGYWEYVPENSTMAVQAAINACIEMSEIDVRLTYDGVPVLQHDLSIERTTTGDGYINNVNWNYYSEQFYLNRYSQPYFQLAKQPGPIPSNAPSPLPADWPEAIPTGDAIPVQSLARFLSIMQADNELVLVIDAKDSVGGPPGAPNSYQTLVQAWKAVKAWEAVDSADRQGTEARIIWKIRMPELPSDPLQLDKDFNFCGPNGCPDGSSNLLSSTSGLNLVPIWYGNDNKAKTIATLCAYNNHITEGGENCDGVVHMFSLGYLWNPEIAVDYPGQAGDATLATWKQASANGAFNVTTFYPASDWAEGMSQKTADCCRYRYMQPFQFGVPPGSVNGAVQGAVNPVADQGPIQYTGDLGFINSRGYNWVSGDHVLDLQSLFNALGRRNVSLISY